MTILLDTHALVWIGADDGRLGQGVRDAVVAGIVPLAVSAVTAYEFADLNHRGRFGVDLPLRDLLVQLDAVILDFPASAWTIAADLPPIHRDPVDRMLVAHAIHADLTLATADAIVRRYPVRAIW